MVRVIYESGEGGESERRGEGGRDGGGVGVKEA
jgi:hypothetical protein